MRSRNRAQQPRERGTGSFGRQRRRGVGASEPKSPPSTGHSLRVARRRARKVDDSIWDGDAQVFRAPPPWGRTRTRASANASHRLWQQAWRASRRRLWPTRTQGSRVPGPASHRSKLGGREWMAQRGSLTVFFRPARRLHLHLMRPTEGRWTLVSLLWRRLVPLTWAATIKSRGIRGVDTGPSAVSEACYDASASPAESITSHTDGWLGLSRSVRQRPKPWKPVEQGTPAQIAVRFSQCVGSCFSDSFPGPIRTRPRCAIWALCTRAFLGGDPLAGSQPLHPGASDRHPGTLEPLIVWTHGAQRRQK